MAYRAEYLWIDGSEPTREIRSKTKILADGAEPGIWATTAPAPTRPPATIPTSS